MILVLNRIYFPEGTNGTLVYKGKTICHTIELPWKANRPQISCIPEGEYFIVKRYSTKFGWHLELVEVPNRSLILIHPANNAALQLRGCIAPVSQLAAPGQGRKSRLAMQQLTAIVFRELDAKESVLLLIQSQSKVEN
ncbi:DUF5675 family protein [Flavobacterium sp. TMP13]|uniref:DUF5675 family protein n=1 Tax=unclassified Flavobacterium TaxID=196869 RepID=UPI00076D91AE|nr:DUF5675 family protein [Flavobacterium sp. TAB 87]KVV15866.1 hypothetical protein AP058_00482 [Flavobacterium sp. TAB 87]